jgi:SH3-like domain-containing protein
MTRIVPFLILFLLFAFGSAAAQQEDNKVGAAPHFASLRSGDVNMRTGPGTRYPIEWVYKRKGLPVEVISEFEIWRRVRDSEGAEGWVHKSSLTAKRMAIVTGAPRNLLEDGVNGAAVTAHLEKDTTGQILSCSKDWCRLKFDGVKGYLRKSEFWGVYPNETFN